MSEITQQPDPFDKDVSDTLFNLQKQLLTKLPRYNTSETDKSAILDNLKSQLEILRSVKRKYKIFDYLARFGLK